MESIYVYNDGGRSQAGYKGDTRDCVVRAIAIATLQPYKEIYDDLFNLAKNYGSRKTKKTLKIRRNASPRTGVHKEIYQPYLLGLGFEWFPQMKIGQGCTVHLHKDELPKGRLIVVLSRHLTAVIDGRIHDIYNPQRGSEVGKKNGVNYIKKETRCVYGYYKLKT